MQKSAINDAEDGGSPSNPQCKSNQNGQRETRASAKGPQGELKVLEHAFWTTYEDFVALSTPDELREARCKYNSLRTTGLARVFDNGTFQVEGERFESGTVRTERACQLATQRLVEQIPPERL
jgi:hypothetical protein